MRINQILPVNQFHHLNYSIQQEQLIYSMNFQSQHYLAIFNQTHFFQKVKQ